MNTTNPRKASLQVFLLIAVILFSFSPGGSNAAQAVVECVSITMLATPSSGGSGRVNTTPNCPTDTTKFIKDTVVEIETVPSSNYGFWKWIINGATYNVADGGQFTDPVDITLTGNATVNVYFSIKPTHDNIANAKLIDNITYIDEDVRDPDPNPNPTPIQLNITGATMDDEDPVDIDCGSETVSKGRKTVWYYYDSKTFKESISLRAADDANYSAYLAVWKGSVTPANLVGCNQGAGTLSGDPELIFNTETGTRYYIQIGEIPDIPSPTINYQGSGGNLGFFATIRNVQVEIGDLLMGTYLVGNGERITPSYPGVANGPVRVQNPTTESIIASERAVYNNGFQDTLGFPANQLTTKYWFPWYDYAGMASWIIVGNTSATQAANVEIYIAGAFKESKSVEPNGRWTPSYPGVASGPVEVRCTNCSGSNNIFTSQRILYNGGFQETLGYPDNKLTSTYWFPWYDYAGMASWIVVGNTSATQKANVEIYIAGAFKEGKSIDPNGQWVPSYPGVATGPVEVRCTNCSGDNNIFTSQRIIYNGRLQETLGFPATDLTSKYWYTWYDYAGMASWIVVGNTSATQAANVEIYIAGVLKESKSIEANGRWAPSYPGVATGPVEVRCTNCSGVNNIFTSQRILYNNYFKETLGFPDNQLTSDYWFPWYDYAGMATWIIIANP